MTISKYALIAGAGALALSLAAPASAGPRGAAVAAGVGVGILAGAAIANANNNYYYSDPYYAPAYGPTYYYEPAPAYGYYDNSYAYRSHRWYQGRRDTNATGNW